VVVLTHNRPAELARTLVALRELPERPELIVVDNASTPDLLAPVRGRFADATWLRCARNQGAAGRNAGVARARTRYVAFCDDDTWWAPGSLRRAADLLDAYANVAAVSARVLVGDAQHEDVTCARMAASPLRSAGLPGPALIGFMAGACVMRTAAYRAVGGYEPRLFLGAEEWLMALDFAARGWRMVYARGVVTHHHPSPARDAHGRRVVLARNRVWIAWLRLPLRDALAASWRALREVASRGLLARTLGATLRGLPWALRHRHVVPRRVAAMVRAVMTATAPCARATH
jgi:GT2 family glycosyltransferase